MNSLPDAPACLSRGGGWGLGGGGWPSRCQPACNKGEVEKYSERERENVHATVRGAFFMTLYGREPRGGREWLLTRCRLDM